MCSIVGLGIPGSGRVRTGFRNVFVSILLLCFTSLSKNWLPQCFCKYSVVCFTSLSKNWLPQCFYKYSVAMFH